MQSRPTGYTQGWDCSCSTFIEKGTLVSTEITSTMLHPQIQLPGKTLICHFWVHLPLLRAHRAPLHFIAKEMQFYCPACLPFHCWMNLCDASPQPSSAGSLSPKSPVAPAAGGDTPTPQTPQCCPGSQGKDTAGMFLLHWCFLCVYGFADADGLQEEGRVAVRHGVTLMAIPTPQSPVLVLLGNTLNFRTHLSPQSHL